MGTDYSCRHAAVLMEQLPAESRTARAQNPEAAGGTPAYLLWRIEHTLRVIAWQSTEDGAKGRRPPKPLPTPADRARVERRLQATDIDFINQKLGFAEVADGN